MSSHDEALAIMTNAILERFKLDPASADIQVSDMTIHNNGRDIITWCAFNFLEEHDDHIRVWGAAKLITWENITRTKPLISWFRADAGR